MFCPLIREHRLHGHFGGPLPQLEGEGKRIDSEPPIQQLREQVQVVQVLGATMKVLREEDPQRAPEEQVLSSLQGSPARTIQQALMYLSSSCFQLESIHCLPQLQSSCNNTSQWHSCSMDTYGGACTCFASNIVCSSSSHRLCYMQLPTVSPMYGASLNNLGHLVASLAGSLALRLHTGFLRLNSALSH